MPFVKPRPQSPMWGWLPSIMPGRAVAVAALVLALGIGHQVRRIRKAADLLGLELALV